MALSWGANDLERTLGLRLGNGEGRFEPLLWGEALIVAVEVPEQQI